MTPKQFSALSKKASVLRSKLDEMELALQAGRSKLIKSTQMVKTENDTIRISNNKHLIVLKRNRYNRYSMKVDGVTVNTDSLLSINDTRFCLAMGYDLS
jgi:hypothetical protein